MLRRILCGCALALAIFCAAKADAQLVGWWTFDDSTANDSSGLNNNGTFQSGATTSAIFAPVLGGGRSLQLASGASGSQHVLVPHNASLDWTTGGTISAWVNTSTPFQWDAILAKSPDNGSGANHAGNYELRIENGSRPPTFLWEQTAAGLSDTTSVAGPGGFPDNTWAHLAVTTNGSLARFFVNGNQVGAAAMPAGFGETNTNPLYIGSRADLFTTMDGRLDDVAVYNAAINPIQIKALATGAITPGTLLAQITPVTATASSFLGGGFNRPASATVDGVGQTTIVPDLGAPGTGMWLSSGVGFGAINDPNPQITFDLGAVKNLDGMTIYNYNEAGQFTGRGIDQFELLLSDDNFVSDIRSAGIFDLNAAPGNGTNPGQAFLLDEVAQFVRFDIMSNINGIQFPNANITGDFNFVGLNEVEFFGSELAVPEPASVTVWALVGVVALAAGWRRFGRRKVA